MKLLFDENLSFRLISFLSDVFPDSVHVHKIGLGNASDENIWEHARATRVHDCQQGFGFSRAQPRERVSAQDRLDHPRKLQH